MKILFLLAAFSFGLCKYSNGQIICILCYNQNDSISIGVNNLLLNGGFENGCTLNGSFCPNSTYYACDISNWTCVGGGYYTYAHMYDNSFSVIVEGSMAAYFGNNFCNPCSATIGDTSCINNAECTVTGIPIGFPLSGPNYGGTTGVCLEQTVNGLIPGNTYVLEFWAGGESDNGTYTKEGIFAVNVGFGDTMLREKPTPSGIGIGTTYIIEFNANSPSHTIKFTNWGHLSAYYTELIIDNVRLYTLAELSPSVPSCSSSSPSSFAASDTILCEKFCINFFDQSTNNPIAWQWLFPGGAPSSSTVQNPNNICYDIPGTYDVTLITTNANGNDTLTMPAYITVNPTPPFPTITQVGYTLTSSPASSYQWQLNSVDIPGATNQSYNVLQTGLYTVIVGDSNGCVNSASQYVLISGIDEAGDATISIYPNPSSGSFTIEWPYAATGEEISIDVVNTLGQKVFSSSESRSIGTIADFKQIDLGDVVQGVYFITIKTKNDFLRKKIIITHLR